jgi:hypothetical protein
MYASMLISIEVERERNENEKVLYEEQAIMD